MTSCSPTRTPVPLREQIEFSFGRVISELAGDFFVRNNSGTNQITLLTLHSADKNPSTIKYVEARRTVLSLPIFRDDLSGFCKFLRLYNSHLIRSVDRMAMYGNPSEALDLYRLIERLDCCGPPDADLVHRKLIAKDMIQKIHPEETFRELGALMYEPKPSLFSTDDCVVRHITNSLIDVPVESFK